MGAAQRSVHSPAEPDTVGQAAIAVSEARQLIARLRRDPASRDTVIQLLFLCERLGEISQDLREAAEADQAAASALSEYVASRRAADSQPVAGPEHSKPGPLGLVRALIPAVPLVGLGTGLRAAIRAHHRAVTGMAGTTMLAIGMTVATVQIREVPHQTAIPHVQLVPAAASPAAARHRPQTSRNPRKRRPHSTRADPAPSAPRPGPSVSPSSSPSPSTSGSEQTGTVQVPSPVLHAGPDGNVQLVITCTGGPCNWIAYTDSSAIVLHETHGHLEPGETCVIPVTAAGNGVVTIGPGGATVRIISGT